MRARFLLPIPALLIVAAASAGTVEYNAIPTAPNSYLLSYSFSGFVIHQYEQIDIRFDPSLYSSLSNGVAPAGFTVLLLQPDNPPGEFGDLKATAVVANPLLSGPISVQVSLFSPYLPGSQPFFLNQFDENNNFLFTEQAGTTIQGVDGPEPGSFELVVVGMFAITLALLLRPRPQLSSKR